MVKQPVRVRKDGFKDYGVITDGEKIEVPRTWFPACCDCGLVHRMEFRFEREDKKTGKRMLTVQIFRDNRKTAGRRRAKGITRIEKAGKTKVIVVK